MKIGLITDIHEHVEELRFALAACDRHQVERIICLGDVFETGAAIHETVALLADRNVAGVWGNHDFGLCSHPSALASTRRVRYGDAVLDYMATYQPCLAQDDCLFSHVEPWRDLNDVMGLWYLGGVPDDVEKAARSFDARPQRVMFTGHHHRWFLTTRAGPIRWTGDRAIRLESPERYLVVVAAVSEGHCAIYDTCTGELMPIALRTDGATG
jgi:hypothetical protein